MDRYVLMVPTLRAQEVEEEPRRKRPSEWCADLAEGPRVGHWMLAGIAGTSAPGWAFVCCALCVFGSPSSALMLLTPVSVWFCSPGSTHVTGQQIPTTHHPARLELHVTMHGVPFSTSATLGGSSLLSVSIL